MRDQIWIAAAPPGVWSSGPAVLYGESAVKEYESMGWIVTGPYKLEVT